MNERRYNGIEYIDVEDYEIDDRVIARYDPHLGPGKIVDVRDVCGVDLYIVRFDDPERADRGYPDDALKRA